MKVSCENGVGARWIGLVRYWALLMVSPAARERRRFGIAYAVCLTVLSDGDESEREVRRRLLLRALHISWVEFQRLTKFRVKMESAACRELRKTAGSRGSI